MDKDSFVEYDLFMEHDCRDFDMEKEENMVNKLICIVWKCEWLYSIMCDGTGGGGGFGVIWWANALYAAFQTFYVPTKVLLN